MFYLNSKAKTILRMLATSILAIFIIANVVVLALDPVNLENSDAQMASRIAEQPTKVLNETPLQFKNIKYKICYDTCTGSNLLDTVNTAIIQLKTAINSGDYTTEAQKTMLQEVSRLETISTKIESNIDKINAWESEYFYATKTWQFFKQRGYSDVVVSAILGNMMIETSGGSLALKPTIYDPPREYYGLCQWSLYYRPEVADMSFEDQLEYLESDMEKEFNAFGGCYRQGFTYNDFLAMTDPAEAAFVFAKVYERCAADYYTIREHAAVKAYNYFNLNV